MTDTTFVQDGPSRAWQFVVDVRKQALRKSMETLRIWVSDRHDGFAEHTIEGITVRRRCTQEDTEKKVGDPQKKGLRQPEQLCRTNRRGNDGLSHVFVGVNLEKTYGGMLEQNLLRFFMGTTVRHRGLVCHSVTELGMPQSSPMTHIGYLVITYMFLTEYTQ